jgi:toxin ParE1/3/4
VSHRLEFSPEALGDLTGLYDYIARRDGAERAMGYVDRIEACCRNLSLFPERGARRDDLRRGLRTLGFERRAVIAFLVATDTVTILRILYGGRDLETIFPRLAAGLPFAIGIGNDKRGCGRGHFGSNAASVNTIQKSFSAFPALNNRSRQ